MKWGAPTIAEYGRRAGFVGAELHTATAIALAGSGGIDHYDHQVGLPGSGRYVGLWALNVDEWPEYSADELTDPHRAAEAAHELTRRCAGFGWSAVWRNGAEAHYVEHAATAHTLDPYQERSPAPNRCHTARHELAAMATRLERHARHG